MAKQGSSKERLQKVAARRESLRQRRRERRATVSGSTAAVSASGSYVYVDSWNAYAYSDGFLSVVATVTPQGSYQIEAVAISSAPDTEGITFYALSEVSMDPNAFLVEVIVDTTFALPTPSKIVSVVGGSVMDTDGNSQPFRYQVDFDLTQNEAAAPTAANR